MSDIANFGLDKTDDGEEGKWRVYTETVTGRPGHVTVENATKAEAKREALDYTRHTEVISVEDFTRGSINHPYHEGM